MNVRFSDEYEAFREEVVSFITAHWTSKPAEERDPASFRKSAIGAGYLYRGVPVAYGGSEQPPDAIRAHIIREELARAKAPGEFGGNSTNIFLPMLLAEGEDWQKKAFIPPTISGEYVWAQGYSEPGAGSDLAGLQTKAWLEGDEWVIQGQKIWTSNAHRATHMHALVRTEPDAPKHDGISYLIVPMNQPGITVRPLKQITGEATFNEVFFDEARTPKDWIIGKRGGGWAVSKTTLSFERNSVGGAEASAALFGKLLKLSKTTNLNGRPAIEDENIRDELVRIQAMVTAHRFAGLRQLTSSAAGKPGSPASGAFTKLYSSMIAERIARVAQAVMGDAAIAEAPGNRGAGIWVKQYMNSIAAQIGGGTSNIQRNIIGERALGLPRDQV